MRGKYKHRAANRRAHRQQEDVEREAAYQLDLRRRQQQAEQREAAALLRLADLAASFKAYREAVSPANAAETHVVELKQSCDALAADLRRAARLFNEEFSVTFARKETRNGGYMKESSSDLFAVDFLDALKEVEDEFGIRQRKPTSGRSGFAHAQSPTP